MLACHEYESSEFLNTTDSIRLMDLYCVRNTQPLETSQSRGICNVKLEMEVCFTETYSLEESQPHQFFDTAGNRLIKTSGSILKLFRLFPFLDSARPLQKVGCRKIISISFCGNTYF